MFWLFVVVVVLLEDGGKGGDRTRLEKLTHQRSGRSKRPDRRTAVGTPAAVSVVVTIVLVPIRAHVGHRVGDAGRGVRRRLHGLTLSDGVGRVKWFLARILGTKVARPTNRSRMFSSAREYLGQAEPHPKCRRPQKGPSRGRNREVWISAESRRWESTA